MLKVTLTLGIGLLLLSYTAPYIFGTAPVATLVAVALIVIEAGVSIFENVTDTETGALSIVNVPEAGLGEYELEALLVIE